MEKFARISRLMQFISDPCIVPVILSYQFRIRPFPYFEGVKIIKSVLLLLNKASSIALGSSNHINRSCVCEFGYVLSTLAQL